MMEINETGTKYDLFHFLLFLSIWNTNLCSDEVIFDLLKHEEDIPRFPIQANGANYLSNALN